MSHYHTLGFVHALSLCSDHKWDHFQEVVENDVELKDYMGWLMNQTVAATDIEARRQAFLSLDYLIGYSKKTIKLLTQDCLGFAEASLAYPPEGESMEEEDVRLKGGQRLLIHIVKIAPDLREKAFLTLKKTWLSNYTPDSPEFLDASRNFYFGLAAYTLPLRLWEKVATDVFGKDKDYIHALLRYRIEQFGLSDDPFEIPYVINLCKRDSSCLRPETREQAQKTLTSLLKKTNAGLAELKDVTSGFREASTLGAAIASVAGPVVGLVLKQKSATAAKTIARGLADTPPIQAEAARAMIAMGAWPETRPFITDDMKQSANGLSEMTLARLSRKEKTALAQLLATPREPSRLGRLKDWSKKIGL